MKTRSRKERLAFAVVALLGIALIAFLAFSLSPDVRIGCVHILGRLAADDWLAGMVEDDDNDVRAAATEALISRGDQAVPALIRRLDLPEETDRATAAPLLGQIGPTARTAMLALKRCLHEDPEPANRAQAALAFARIGRDDPEVTAELVRLLGSTTEEDRIGAAFACRMIGPDAKHMLPALVAALNDPEPEIREGVLQALNAVAGSLGDEDAALRDPALAASKKAMASLRTGRGPNGP